VNIQAAVALDISFNLLQLSHPLRQLSLLICFAASLLLLELLNRLLMAIRSNRPVTLTKSTILLEWLTTTLLATGFYPSWATVLLAVVIHPKCYVRGQCEF